MTYRVHLRTVIMLFLTLFGGSIVLAFITLQKQDYEFLFTHQGHKQALAVSRNVQEQLRTLLHEPTIISEFLRNEIRRGNHTVTRNFSNISDLLRSFSRNLPHTMSQVSTINYGNHHGYFAGIRIN
ncbi:MAG: hypothetical protein ACQEQV_08360, partial [Fibrobacterota bacterium]